MFRLRRVTMVVAVLMAVPGTGANVSAGGKSLRQATSAVRPAADSASTRYEPPRLRALSSARRAEDRCAVVQEWIGHLRQEFPQWNPAGPRDRYWNIRVANLFRDEIFSQVFGRPYGQLTAGARRDLHGEAIARCSGLEPYRNFLDPAFLGTEGWFASPSFSWALESLHKSRASLDATLSTVAAAPATREGFDSLARSLDEGVDRLGDLWTSELTYFRSAIAARQAAVAAALVSEWAASLDRPSADGESLAAARQLAAARAEIDIVLNALHATERTVVEDKLRTRREKLLEAALPEWQRRLTSGPLTASALDQAATELAELFPFDNDTSLRVYAEYERPLLARREEQKGEQERQATIARADAARRAETAAAAERQARAEREQAERAAETARLDAERLEAARLATAETKRSALQPEPGAQPSTTSSAPIVPARDDSRRSDDTTTASGAGVPAGAAELAASASVDPTVKHRCDDLAAHPQDPRNPFGTGVADRALAPAAAITQCVAAVKANPQSGRMKFQLGRAYWVAKRYEDALDLFLAAEELGYSPAYLYLGLAYERGLVAGETADLATAAEMYLIAAADGFAPAAEAYEGIEWSWDIDFDAFARPAFVKAVYTNDFSGYERPGSGSGTQTQTPAAGGARGQRDALMTYLLGVQAFLELRPNEYDETCPSLLDGRVSSGLEEITRVEILGLPAKSQSPWNDVMRMMNQGLEGMAATSAKTERLAEAKQNGTDDIYALVLDYGGCSGEPVKQFYRNLAQFVSAAREGL